MSNEPLIIMDEMFPTRRDNRHFQYFIESIIYNHGQVAGGFFGDHECCMSAAGVLPKSLRWIDANGRLCSSFQLNNNNNFSPFGRHGDFLLLSTTRGRCNILEISRLATVSVLLLYLIWWEKHVFFIIMGETFPASRFRH